MKKEYMPPEAEIEMFILSQYSAITTSGLDSDTEEEVEW